MYLEKFRLDGRIAVITGAARGIGLATAEALSEAGATVVIADMDDKAAAKAAARLKAGWIALDVKPVDRLLRAGRWWLYLLVRLAPRRWNARNVSRKGAVRGVINGAMFDFC